MNTHVVVGAGPVGTHLARLLLARGEHVRVVTRRGTGPAGADLTALDAAHAPALVAACVDAAAIYNCVNPAYHRWATDWPPIADALVAAAQANGAVLATTGNLYPYGPVTGPIVEGLPDAATGTKGRVRAAMTRQALQAHRDGRIRAVEVRGSDYLGGSSLLSAVVTPALRKGRTAYVPADLDAPHSWTSVADVARLLATVAEHESAWGRIWHVPSAPPVSIRTLAQMAADRLGTPLKLRAMPYAVLWAAGMVVPVARELRETQYQFRAPFVLDASDAQDTFGLAPAPLEQSVALDLDATSSATGGPA